MPNIIGVTRLYHWPGFRENLPNGKHLSLRRDRVTEIQELSQKSQWQHVRSEDNPADILSRGARPEVLKDHTL